MNEEPSDSDWKLSSDKEMQEAAKQARRQPMTAGRAGEFIGALVGVCVAGLACLIYFLVLPVIHFWVVGAIFSGCFLGGAWIGKKSFTALKRKPPAK